MQGLAAVRFCIINYFLSQVYCVQERTQLCDSGLCNASGFRIILGYTYTHRGTFSELVMVGHLEKELP